MEATQISNLTTYKTKFLILQLQNILKGNTLKNLLSEVNNDNDDKNNDQNQPSKHSKNRWEDILWKEKQERLMTFCTCLFSCSREMNAEKVAGSPLEHQHFCGLWQKSFWHCQKGFPAGYVLQVCWKEISSFAHQSPGFLDQIDPPDNLHSASEQKQHAKLQQKVIRHQSIGNKISCCLVTDHMFVAFAHTKTNREDITTEQQIKEWTTNLSVGISQIVAGHTWQWNRTVSWKYSPLHYSA